MLKKIPYGIKVRIRGSEETGYKVESCIHYNRFFRFLNYWSGVCSYDTSKGITWVFTTLDEAKTVADKEYNNWIKYYTDKEQGVKARKTVGNKIVWESRNG